MDHHTFSQQHRLKMVAAANAYIGREPLFSRPCQITEMCGAQSISRAIVRSTVFSTISSWGQASKSSWQRCAQVHRTYGSPNLKRVCDHHFGEPRNRGSSHFIYKTPWPGDPRVNIQNKGGAAKPYQVRQVLSAIDHLEEKSHEC